MYKQFTLGKNERLKSRKLIEEIFSSGQRFAFSPFHIFYLIKKTNDNASATVQVGAGAATKNFKKAVDRNRIKRLIREAYRIQKQPLQKTVANNQCQLAVFFIYTGKELPTFTTVKEKMSIILDKLITIADENHSSNT